MTFSANDKALSGLAGLAGRMHIAFVEAEHMVGRALVRRVQIGMTSGAKSGRVYAHPGKGTYTASAPGEYSAVVSGQLYGSINYQVSGSYISFYATAAHAGYQEFRTSKMEARENLKRAIDESDGEIKSIIDQVLWRALGGAGAGGG